MFRLLQFPQLVFTEIINQLKYCEIIILSVCSQKMRCLVMHHRDKTQNWPLILGEPLARFVSVSDNLKNGCLLVVVKPDPGNITETISIGKFHQVPCTIHRELGALMTYWKDQTEGLKAVVAYVFELLNVTKVDLVQFHWSNLWWFDWLKARGIAIRSTLFSKEKKGVLPIPGEQFSQIFSKCESKQLILHNTPEENYHYEGTFHSYDYFIIDFGFWVTIQNLKSMDSMYMTAWGSKLNSLDINQFLRHWLKMGNPRLKFFGIELDGHFVFDEIDVEIRDRLHLVDEKREYNVSGNKHKLDQSYDLRREEDGEILTLFWQRINTGNVEILMMTWPDQMGKTHQQHAKKTEGGVIV